MSDDAYTSFLNKANEDLSASPYQPQQSSITARPETVTLNVDNAQIPPSLQSVDAYYISETDEPFEPVVLKWDGAGKGIWPGASQLSTLISPRADLSSNIETLSPSSFDPQSQYPSALRAVRGAVRGDESNVEVKVYRVDVGGSRVEYYVLALDAEGGKVIGLRARAVET